MENPRHFFHRLYFYYLIIDPTASPSEKIASGFSFRDGGG